MKKFISALASAKDADDTENLVANDGDADNNERDSLRSPNENGDSHPPDTLYKSFQHTRPLSCPPEHQASIQRSFKDATGGKQGYPKTGHQLLPASSASDLASIKETTDQCAEDLVSNLDSENTVKDTANLIHPKMHSSNGYVESTMPEKQSPYTSTSEIVDADGQSKKQPKETGNRFFVYFLSCFATIGGLLFGYDTGIVSGSMLLLQPYFNLNTIWQEAIVSGTIGAAAVFALVSGFMCDFIGRKKTIMIASFVFAVGAIVMAVSPNKEVLLVGRIVVGAGIGFASMTVPVYVAEAAPADIRGRLVTLNQLFITIGILISSIVAGAFSTMEETGWRYMLGLACVPGVIQFLGFFYLPESPRWLLAKGREEDARKVLIRMRGHNDVEDEINEAKEGDKHQEKGFVLGKMLKTPHVRKALLIGCTLQLFQQLCGINTVIYYSATILKMAGFSPSLAVWLVCVPFSVNFLATFIGVWAVERLGRKLLLIISYIGITIALVVLAVGFQLSSIHSPSVNTTLSMPEMNSSCSTYSSCEKCIKNTDCGFCYDENDIEVASCLMVGSDEKDIHSDYGRCSKNTTGPHLKWTFGFCPTDYAWMAVLGLGLFVLSFAPGLGPMPWTINSEIYPMWARGTGNAIATAVNWVFNLIVSFTFLTLTEELTEYGTFYLYACVCIVGMIFTIIFVPETKNKSLEEVEELFMTPKLREEHRRQRQAATDITIEDPKPTDTKL